MKKLPLLLLFVSLNLSAQCYPGTFSKDSQTVIDLLKCDSDCEDVISIRKDVLQGIVLNFYADGYLAKEGDLKPLIFRLNDLYEYIERNN